MTNLHDVYLIPCSNKPWHIKTIAVGFLEGLIVSILGAIALSAAGLALSVMRLILSQGVHVITFLSPQKPSFSPNNLSTILLYELGS